MIGSQFNAPGPVRRLLIGPNWSGELPEGFVGADIVQSTSNFAGLAARLALTDAAARWRERFKTLPNGAGSWWT